MNKAYEFLTKEVGIKYRDTIVVGVSGGPDSMALLYMLIVLKKETDISIICAHVNHNTREENEAERLFIERYCDNNQIIFESMKIEEYGDDNFHNEARSKRYVYFDSIVRKYGAEYLITAHHGDDLIETILMRIVRGSTFKGYAGFAKIVSMGDYKILRPLIHVTKEEILNYNNQHNVKWVEDSSNKKDKYTRNRYRKRVLPFLKSEESKVHEKFFKFSQTLFDYNEYIDQQMFKTLNDVYNQNILNIEKFKELEKVIQNKIINYILEMIYHDDLMLIYDSHVDLIYRLIESSKPNSYIYLPNGIKIIKSYNNLNFIKEELEPHEYEIELISYVNLPNGMNIELVNSCDWTNNYACRLDSSEIKLPLHVRNRRFGDRMEVKGLLGSKKVKDIFIDEKIAGFDRETWPIVVDSMEKIVWLPGLKKSKYDKAKDENYDIIIKYY
ncbi:MAG: tRNA lysidine(34) synthetase TilS [Bacilli bacterium]|jgi:tRNA(Ile)-lysidine synthase